MEGEVGPVKKEKSKAWLELRQNAPEMAKAGLRNAGRWLGERFALEPARALGVLREGLTRHAPKLALALVLCAALPVTASLKASLGMGLASTVVLLLSSMVVALLPGHLPQRTRCIVNFVLAAVLAAAAALFVQERFPAAGSGIGGALPLVAVNCLLLARAEGFAAGLTPSYAALDGLSAGLELTLALGTLGSFRELLGGGTLWGKALFGPSLQPVLLLATPCGGLLLLGAIAAGARWLRGKIVGRWRRV
ncbi:Rnf-Nqr subunit, membrane protein [uncultured Eubacteriales bacterium]|uniref:Rnf-Nqr subunit, membrane protein n=1 Tax=uncultured Eubacteriales bacterium TaxID=172733 RepID=A0A212J329_9FIRM|nr:Rnf-Nqr subunit, membrane protein [uncultured Eubacteriales bacterium]